MYCRSPEHSYTANFPKNYLCVDCNKRQSIKLLELSNFEPTNENLYDLELKAFKEYLEKRYPLCGSCVSTVRSVLSKQALWLIRFKMLSFRHKSVKAITSVSVFARERCYLVSVTLKASRVDLKLNHYRCGAENVQLLLSAFQRHFI